MIELECRCGTKFQVKPSRVGKAKFCSYACMYKYKDHSHLLKYKGEQHSHWTGDRVGIGAVHAWVHKHFGKANKCEHCGLTEMPKGKKVFFHWANISQEYKRIRSDWKQLCMVCHHVFDNHTKLSLEQVSEIRVRYKNGEFITKLAPEYKVGTSTIWRVVNHEVMAYA